MGLLKKKKSDLCFDSKSYDFNLLQCFDMMVSKQDIQSIKTSGFATTHVVVSVRHPITY